MTLDFLECTIYNPLASKPNKIKSKKLIKLPFVNKNMDMINSKINDKNVKKNLPTKLNQTEQVLTVYTLTKTIRSKIFKP